MSKKCLTLRKPENRCKDIPDYSKCLGTSRFCVADLHLPLVSRLYNGNSKFGFEFAQVEALYFSFHLPAITPPSSPVLPRPACR